jgi:uncharacterized protein with PIN domain
MKCKEKDCCGEININDEVSLQTGCENVSRTPVFSTAYPCKKCGRLYWKDGTPIFNKNGKKAFLLKKIELR